MTVRGSRAEEVALIHLWAQRHSVYPIAVATVALAALSAVISHTVWTPQLNGAQASISVSTATAALAGATLPGLLATPDPISELRSPRNVTTLRRVQGMAMLALGTIAFGLALPGRDPDWNALQTYLLVVATSLVLTRYAGALSAAAVLAGYVGACLFAGAEPDEGARWWAIPLQQPAQATAGLALLGTLAVLAVHASFHTPPLPPGHRSRSRFTTFR